MKRWLSVRPLAGLAVLVAILLVVSLQASLVNQNSLQRSASANGPKEVTVKDVSGEAVQALAGITAVSSLTNQYYSPSLGVTFTYDSSQLALSEQSPGVLAELRSDVWTGNIQSINKSNWDAAQAAFMKNNSPFWPHAKPQNPQTVGEVEYFTVQVTNPAVVGQTPLVEHYTVLARRVSKAYVFITLRQTVQTEVAPTAVVEIFAQLLQSAVTGNQLPSGPRRVALADNVISIQYDPQAWTTIGGDGYRTIFRFNLPAKGSSNTSVIIDHQTLTSPRNPQQLQGELDTLLKKAQQTWANSKFKTLNIPKRTTLGDHDFYFVRYQYRDALRITHVITEYQGYVAEKRLLVSLHTEEDPNDGAASRELDDLLASIQINATADVLGAQAESDIPKATVLGKPAVVHLFNRSCVKLTIPKTANLPNSSGKNYQLCSAGLGSGFYVNKEGYLVTNAHVAAPNAVDIAVNGLVQGYDPNDFGSRLAIDSVLLLQKQYPNIDFFNAGNDQRVKQMIQSTMVTVVVYGVQQKQFRLGSAEYTNFVQMGHPFEVNTRDLQLRNTDQQLATKLVASRQIDSFYNIAVALSQSKAAGITTPDLALLQIANPEGQYPAIQLAGQGEISAGQSVYVIGFPGVAENSSLFGTQSQTIPTVTKGTVSAVKSNFSESFKLVQIDASIAPGNSGGPIINADGSLLGVATYGISSEQSGDFNAGVSVEEVSKLLSDEHITNEPGSVTVTVLQGLDNFANGYYRWAATNFRQASQESPLLQDELTPLIAESEKRIAAGQDNTPVLTIGNYFIHRQQLWIIGVFAVLLLIIGGLIIFTLVLTFRRRRQQHATVELPTDEQVPLIRPVGPPSEPMAATPTVAVSSQPVESPTSRLRRLGD